jgi:hypothetical protein
LFLLAGLPTTEKGEIMLVRSCSYCGKGLTDTASKNYGIGPVCRKMQNHVLAALIPANVPLARFSLAQLDTKGFTEKAVLTVEGLSQDFTKSDNKDWRKSCARVEWLLSFGVSRKQRSALISVVEALGYLSLASLLSGHAAKGEATVSFEAGRLFVKGPRNKAGHTSLKAIKGRKYHPADKRWSVPSEAYEAFQTTMWKHWPKNTGLEESLEAAKLFNIDAVEATKVVAEVPKVIVTKSGEVFKIASPYNKGFISELKHLVAEASNWKDRRWNPSEKVWEVAEAHKELVVTLVAKHYGEQVSL